MLENYSADNVENAQKLASVLWGDQSFTIQPAQTIRELTIATGHLTNYVPPRLTQMVKNTMHNRMHSKMMGHQILSCLSKSACASIELHKKKYSWKIINGRKEEIGGPTVLALVMVQIKHHYKVDSMQRSQRSRNSRYPHSRTMFKVILMQSKRRKLPLTRRTQPHTRIRHSSGTFLLNSKKLRLMIITLSTSKRRQRSGLWGTLV